jgi:hypothetical protein
MKQVTEDALRQRINRHLAEDGGAIHVAGKGLGRAYWVECCGVITNIGTDLESYARTIGVLADGERLR